MAIGQYTSSTIINDNKIYDHYYYYHYDYPFILKDKLLTQIMPANITRLPSGAATDTSEGPCY